MERKRNLDMSNVCMWQEAEQVEGSGSRGQAELLGKRQQAERLEEKRGQGIEGLDPGSQRFRF